jgi:energy-coupling factor transporter ATP-binding protein EcfA2
VDLLLIGGRSGSGKSSIANELHYLLSEREVMHAVIEGDNLDLAYPKPWRHGLAEARPFVSASLFERPAPPWRPSAAKPTARGRAGEELPRLGLPSCHRLLVGHKIADEVLT